MILRTAHASAIYRAMCELNNIGATLYSGVQSDFYGDRVTISANADGTVIICDGTDSERFANQSEFATAYGI